ncbi:MAG: aldo/keto reductase [Thermoproteota archaeon]|nr:aldo/keto reductase [Candidatus Brockarchaeota archaeon]
MKYVNLGNSGLKVSQICLGSWHLPRSNERDEYGVLKVDVEETKKAIKIAFDHGMNFIDTANRYHGAMSPVDFNHLGNAEKVLGEVLKDYDRESFVIATKVGGQMAPWMNGQGLSRKHIFWQIRESLKRLKLEYVDVYLIHVPDKETPPLETLTALNDLIKIGKVHYIGSSNLSPEEIVSFMELSKEYKLNGFVTIQEVYNLINRTIEFSKIPLARKYNFTIMAYSPLAQGLLSEKYLKGIPEGSRATYSTGFRETVTKRDLRAIEELSEFAKEKGISLPQLAIAWILSKQRNLGVNIVPIIGVSSSQQLVENLQALEISLSEDEIRRIEEIASRMKL